MIIYTPEDLLMNFKHCTFFFSSSSSLYLYEAAPTTIIIFLENKCSEFFKYKARQLITKTKNPQKLLVKSCVLRKLQVYNPHLLKDFA